MNKDLLQRLIPLYGEREARQLLLIACEEYAGLDRTALVGGASVSDTAFERIQACVDRLCEGEPIQYIIGKADFYGRRFLVGPSVLIPRQETELLCREAILTAGRMPADGRQPRILDLCTGSGCIAWTLAAELPEALLTGIDISEPALAVARSQAALMPPECRDRVAFARSDLMQEPALSGTFDMIVSNPPYVMEKERALMQRNVLEHEPALALFVSDGDPLVFYRRIRVWADALLALGGCFIVEINEALGPQTAAVFEGYENVTVLQDLSGRDRFVKGTRRF